MNINIDLGMILALVSIATSAFTLVAVFTKLEHRFTKLETMQNIMTKILLDDIGNKQKDHN